MLKFFKRLVSKQEKMPHFTDKPSPFSKIIKTLQENVDNLNYEINKYKCPACGAGLVYEEDPQSSGAGKESSEDGVKGADENCPRDVYPRRHLLIHLKNSKATANKNTKSREGEREIKNDPSSEDYKKLLEDEKTTCKTLQEVNKKYALQIAELGKTLSERESDVKDFRMLISQLQDEKKTMTETIEERENRIGKLNVTLRETEGRLQKEIESLRDIEKRLSTDIENFKKTLKENEILIGNIKSKDSKQESAIQDLRRKLKGMNETLEKTQRDNANDVDRLERSHMSSLEVKDKELRTLKERCTELERDIEKISRKEIAVGFSTTLAPSMSTLLLDGLMTQLTQRLTVEGVDLVRRPFYGNTDFNCPLLAICVNVSRIGADAKEALKGVVKVGNQKDVVLLVFHHKEAHALPSQSSDRLLTGAEFSNLGTIIDLAFLSQRGIYECDMNMMGIERIVSFLLQYKSQKQ